MQIEGLNKRFRRAKTFKRMISEFDYKHPVLSALFFMTCYVIIPVFLFLLLCLYCQKDTTLPEDTAKRATFRYVVVIERTNGLKDTLIYHDFKSKEDVIHVKVKGSKRPLTIATKGENAFGVGVDNEIKIDEVKSYKIIK